jgi:membrane protein DedA with SNARE-associated domain
VRQTPIAVSGHEIHHLLHEYGLGLVFAITGLQALGAPLPGTTALIAAALYASTSHGLPIVGVIAAGALGAIAGTSAGFAVGRWGGERLLVVAARRLRQNPEHVRHIRAEFADSGRAWLFIGRFVTGLRNVVGLLAGASGMPIRRFLPVCAAAAIVWATLNGLEYYFFGHALQSAGTWLQVVLISVGIGWTVVSLRVIRVRAMRRIEAARE